ncbi:hypothetical protein B0H10DRAFT_750863 [Mycena sp. CBHHK59/15]|nr:hypothetical protein B0H10DRAFT_750863 [Mycena sp. CBHHK59/15]
MGPQSYPVRVRIQEGHRSDCYRVLESRYARAHPVPAALAQIEHGHAGTVAICVHRRGLVPSPLPLPFTGAGARAEAVGQLALRAPRDARRHARFRGPVCFARAGLWVLLSVGPGCALEHHHPHARRRRV